MKVQLANTYSPTKNYRVASWYASPKFDGVRAIFIPGKGLFTRNNQPISGFMHMSEILDGICTNCGLSFIDGELILNGSSFQASQSVILSAQHPDKSNVEFHVFAVGGNFHDTAEMIAALPHLPGENIFRVDSVLIPNTFEAIEQACENFTAMGFEGVVLRHTCIPYAEGRNNSLLKHKFFKEADLRITAIHEGAGRLEGTLGSLTVEGLIDGSCVRADVGTGFTDEDRKILFADKNLTGKIITIKYQSLTDKPGNEGYYSLRFPAFIGLKQDRDFDTPEAVIPSQKFTGESNCDFGKYGFVSATFQPTFPDMPANAETIKAQAEAFISQMEQWKSQLKNCNSIRDGLKLMDDLKLTLLEIMLFGQYLRVNLKGCRAEKYELSRRIVEALIAVKGGVKNVADLLQSEGSQRNQEYGSGKSATQRQLDTARRIPQQRASMVRTCADGGLKLFEEWQKFIRRV